MCYASVVGAQRECGGCDGNQQERPLGRLGRDLKDDPEIPREYVLESVRISTIDQVVNALNDAREAAGLSKAALARAISAEPAVIRRLFSAGQVNPTLGTLAEVAAALGMRITVEPLPAAERGQVTAPLPQGRSADTCPWWSTWLGCAHPDIGKQL